MTTLSPPVSLPARRPDQRAHPTTSTTPTRGVREWVNLAHLTLLAQRVSFGRFLFFLLVFISVVLAIAWKNTFASFDHFLANAFNRFESREVLGVGPECRYSLASSIALFLFIHLFQFTVFTYAMHYELWYARANKKRAMLDTESWTRFDP